MQTATPTERKAMNPALKTHPVSEDVAIDRLKGDWDADGTTSIHLPRDVAERLLAERGWTRTIQAGWLSPNGYVAWLTDEALTIALIAENS
jgi:hypothetical protein